MKVTWSLCYVRPNLCLQLMDFRILVSALSSSYNINELLQEEKNTDFKVWLENEMLYENIIMSCYELIIMHLNFVKKTLSFLMYLSKFIKRMKQKKVNFNVIFIFQVRKITTQKVNKVLQRFAYLHRHPLKQLPQYTKENKNRIYKNLNDHWWVDSHLWLFWNKFYW